MRLKKLFILSAVALLGAAPAKITAQNSLLPWDTVLDYQLAAGKDAGGEAIVADAVGNVFSGGGATDAAGTNHAIVLKTDTTQANWYFSDDTNPDYTQYHSSIYALGLDANGNAYSIGQLWPNSSLPTYWHVRKSSNGGVNWSNVDLYQYTPGRWAYATGFAADDKGNIYVVGIGADQTVVGSGKHTTTNSYNHWLVRKSPDEGQTWALVDDLQSFSGSTGAYGACFVPGAGVFAVGGQFPGTGNSSWVVRRSASGDQGTWSTVDGHFALGAARAVAGDSHGNIYVAGIQVITVTIKTHPLTTSSYYAWVTRKSSDGGNTWSTVDTYEYDAQNRGAYAFGIGRNAAGNVVVAGEAYDGQHTRWIVRTPDSSGVWYTMDDFQPGNGARANGVATDAVGNLLVTGEANDGTSWHWIVRRLAAP